jgi:hypothetical protein
MTATEPQRQRSWLSLGGLWNAFKTFAILFSFLVNFVLIIVLLLVAMQVPTIYGPLKGGLLGPLVNGLYSGFGRMNDASIVRTIEVKDTVPAVFNLPLDQNTTVSLVEPVPLAVPAVVDLGNGNMLNNATVYLTLPAGTQLPVHLALNVPVSQTIPVNLKVGVDIPLKETQLGPEFQKFQTLFQPLDHMVGSLPDDWDGLMACVQRGGLPFACKQP